MLVDWLTKHGVGGVKMPPFVHSNGVDNAPSHWMRAADSLHVDIIPKNGGYVGSPRRNTTYVFPKGHAQQGFQRMVLSDGTTTKGLQTVGFERGSGAKTASPSRTATDP